MINNKTVLVLGAGASMDYGFPSGEQLLQDIINILTGPLFGNKKDSIKLLIASIVCRYFELKKQSKKRDVFSFYQTVSEFQEKFIRSNTASIDDFIEKIPEERIELKIIGKILIIFSISRLENEQRLIYKHEKTDPSHRYYEEVGAGLKVLSLVKGWYGYLWRKIYEGHTIAGNLSNLTIISFNYDRSLEQYLYSSMLGMSQLAEDECKNILNINLFIHHVYGKLGKLSWQNEGGIVNEYIPFKLNEIINEAVTIKGNALSIAEASYIYSTLVGSSKYVDFLDKICRIVDEIRTYTESIKDTFVLDSIKPRLFLCKDLFFLGFGYHPENMKWFNPKGLSSNSALNCAGTTYNIGTQTLIDIKINRLRRLLSTDSNATMERNIKQKNSNYNIQDYFEEVKPIR